MNRNSLSYRGGEVVAAVQHMKDVRNAMVEVWRESKRFRVSDEVGTPPTRKHRGTP